jgi:hypothetical protein
MLSKFSTARFCLLTAFLLTMALGHTSSEGVSLGTSTSLEPTQALIGLECRVYCSKVRPRTAVAEISWKEVRSSRLGGTPLTMSEQQLEVTVYKYGFDKGVYAKPFSIERNQRFRMQPSRTNSPQRIPGLDQLVLVDLQTSRDRSSGPPNANMRTLVDRPDADIIARIEGLETGLNYFWRVPLTVEPGRVLVSEVVRCKAPVCPYDSPRGP